MMAEDSLSQNLPSIPNITHNHNGKGTLICTNVKIKQTFRSQNKETRINVFLKMIGIPSKLINHNRYTKMTQDFIQIYSKSLIKLLLIEYINYQKIYPGLKITSDMLIIIKMIVELQDCNWDTLQMVFGNSMVNILLNNFK